MMVEEEAQQLVKVVVVHMQEAAMVPKAKFAEVDTLAEEQAVVAELVADQQASVDVLRSVAAFVIAAADQQTYVLEGHYA